MSQTFFIKRALRWMKKGTEAAAVSVGVIRPQCLRKNPDFVADHPFLFTVREDKSGVILFMGQVLDPSKH